MKTIDVRVHPSRAKLPREHQLAWEIASYSASRPKIDPEVSEMVACRIVDNAAVALAALNRQPVRSARAMALARPRPGGATLFGFSAALRVHAEWAAWANATAVRELDFHDTFLAADYAHPGDSIAPILAVAQQLGADGGTLARAIAVAYEIHVALAKAICLHCHKKDHIAHLCPATVAGLGALLGLETETIFQAVNQAVHLSFSTRQSRKGEISSWKAFVPGHSGKMAIEALDRAMRGEGAPSPVYEGEDSVIAWMLAGPDAHYQVSLPEPGERPRQILETYTKEHSAEYQAQALIDLAREIRQDIDPSRITEIVIHTSHHTHFVIGTGANDPQKFDPAASRETLDHSLMYIMAVALEDGRWHHDASYTEERRNRQSTLRLWRAIRTTEDASWTRAYHAPNPTERAFGGRVEIRLDDGTVVEREKRVADAHPNGRSPWGFADYVNKFEELTRGIVELDERKAFFDRIRRLAALKSDDVIHLNPVAESPIRCDSPTGIADA